MRILYATDGSEGGLGPARFLANLPHHRDTHVHIVTILGSEDRGDGGAILSAARAALGSFPGHVTTATGRGDSTSQIVDVLLYTADYADADLIAIGASGHSAVARFFLGSVAESVARHARCSVLIARPLTGPLNKVVVGIDGSKSSAAVVEFLKAFPLPAGCEIQLIAVVFPEAAVESARHMLLPNLADEVWALSQKERDDAAGSLMEAAAHLRAAGFTVSTAVRSGTAAIQLLEAAEETGADLLVVGARGISNIDRFLLGSVSERVMRHAHCSVLVVK